MGKTKRYSIQSERIDTVELKVKIGDKDFEIKCHSFHADGDEWDCEIKKPTSYSFSQFIPVIEAIFDSRLLKAKKIKIKFSSNFLEIEKMNSFKEYMDFLCDHIRA